jgi:phosphoglycerate dehydrogenase-like enzyme
MAEIAVLEEDFERYLELLADAGVEAVGTADPDAVADTAILLASPVLAARAVGRLTSLRWIQSTWAGVDALVAAGVPPGVTVTAVKGIFGAQMREFVLGHLLGHAQRVAERMADRSWDETQPTLLVGATLGIMGTGSIGSAVAQAARAFGMEVNGFSRSGAAAAGFDRVLADRLAFAEGLDHLVAILPSTPDTRNLVDADLLRRLRPGAVFINVGRGATVDTAAVVEALRTGSLARAVLDVLPVEPLPDGDPLWDVPGLVITSHTAAWSRCEDVVATFLSNLERHRLGESLVGVVDPVLGY